MMDESKKRKSEASNGGIASKKSKQWRTPNKGQPKYVGPSIEPGDSGIWATCAMGKEGKCTAELRDLFEEYAAKLCDEPSGRIEDVSDSGDGEVDIEAEISKEVQGMKSKHSMKEALFQAVRVDIQCVLFFKTREPVEPVSFVHKICKDAFEGAVTKKHRWVKRLTPMTRMGKATEKGLEEVGRAVLEPVFHAEGSPERKFAIRTTIRNHNIMKRDNIIKHIASAVGPRHSVDLKNYDVLVLVDIYRNTCGMSIVGSDFEKLKRFNLAEIYDPTPKPEAEKNSAALSGLVTQENERTSNTKPDDKPIGKIKEGDDDSSLKLKAEKDGDPDSDVVK